MFVASMTSQIRSRTVPAGRGLLLPPYGAMLDTLPPKYETAVIDQKPYYRFNGVYFVAVAMDGGTKYVVVKPPEQTAQPDRAEIPR